MLNYLETKIINYNKKNIRKHHVSANDSNDKSRNITILVSFLEGLLCRSIIKVNREHNKMQHGTQKPIELMSRLIRLCSNKDDTILDCFMGSGSTGVAAIQTNRKFIGIEYHEEYFNIAVNRIIEIHEKLNIPYEIKEEYITIA